MYFIATGHPSIGLCQIPLNYCRQQAINRSWVYLSARCYGHDSGLSDKNKKPKPDKGNKLFVANRFIVKDHIDIPNGTLTTKRFMYMRDSFEAMTHRTVPVYDHIPMGLKENTCFMVDNQRNKAMRKMKKNALFLDDCGSWSNKERVSVMCKYHFIVNAGIVRQVRRVRGLYYYMSDYKPRKEVIPMHPQPAVEDVLVASLYRSTHSLSNDYRRSICEILHLPECFVPPYKEGIDNYMFVQYLGTFPGYAPHGRNVTTKDPYVRLPAFVRDAVDEYVQQEKRLDVPTIFKDLVRRELLLDTKQNFDSVFIRVLMKRRERTEAQAKDRETTRL